MTGRQLEVPSTENDEATLLPWLSKIKATRNQIIRMSNPGLSSHDDHSYLCYFRNSKTHELGLPTGQIAWLASPEF